MDIADLRRREAVDMPWRAAGWTIVLNGFGRVRLIAAVDKKNLVAAVPIRVRRVWIRVCGKACATRKNRIAGTGNAANLIKRVRTTCAWR